MITYQNITLVTCDSYNTIIPQGFLRIEGDSIHSLGAMADYQPLPQETTFDKSGFIAMPGLINAHTHLGLIPLRSLKDDQPDRLRTYLFPMEQKYMTKEATVKASRYAALESMLNGTTTVCDMYYYADDVAQTLKELNMRAVVGQTIIRDSQIDYQTEENALKHTQRFIKHWQNDSLITPLIAPHGTTTVSLEALKQINRLSKSTKTKVMMHVAEMDYEIEAFLPESPIEYLHRNKTLSSDFIAVHAIHTNNRDRKLLSKSSVVACVGANMKAGKGIPNLDGMLKEGVTVGLGTDGPVSGNTLDMMTVMKLTAMSQKTRENKRDLFPSIQILRMATIENAKILGLDHIIGSLEPNKKADLILIDTSQANMFPIHDIEATLVYQLQPQNIDTVIINGVTVVENHKLTQHDLRALREELTPLIQAIQNN